MIAVCILLVQRLLVAGICGFYDTMVKGKVHLEIKFQTSSAHPRANEESVEIS